MADDSQTCGTVETPSRLMLFYPPDSTPSSLSSLLPSLPLCKPVGHRLILGRSGSADIRLNDERMSRVYAALWHDGKDPFVFRVSNLSERKLLMVNGAMLRYQQEAEVRDGSVLVLDFLEFKAKVCAGDIVAFTYQVSFVKNTVISPGSPKPPDGKCWMLSRQKDSSVMSSCQSQPRTNSLESSGMMVSRLLTCLRSGSLDSGMGYNASHRSAASCLPVRSQSCQDSVGIEFELPENLSTMSSNFSSADRDGSPWSEHGVSSSEPNGGAKLSLNIPPQQSSSDRQFVTSTTATDLKESNTDLKRPSPGLNQASEIPAQSPPLKNLSCWFNISPESAVSQQKMVKPDSSVKDLAGLAQQIQGDLIAKDRSMCPSCQGCGKERAARPTSLGLRPGTRPWQQTLALPDMVPERRRSPVENAEWDTDDPNINQYME